MKLIERRTRKIVASRLKAARQKSGLLQESLAYKSGINQTTLSTREMGRVSISIESLVRMAVIMGIEPSELIPTLKEVKDGKMQ